ncbi:MAG: glycosyl-4,4'-diaponeurosporenoate acyltransferase [Clostridia bacterium]|nr:glycosyl-4,4'-diaponeurosporenoate acyltransferase [Clostridia bacterium]
MKFITCLCYLGIVSFLFFLLGRILPKKWFSCRAFPFRRLEFEDKTDFYEQIKIKLWKDKLPDMSKLFPGLIVPKQLVRLSDKKEVEILISETCIAEFIHFLLCIAGFGCTFIWEGIGGYIVSALYAIGNIPFILAQRYNRPRLIRLNNLLQNFSDENPKALESC